MKTSTVTITAIPMSRYLGMTTGYAFTYPAPMQQSYEYELFLGMMQARLDIARDDQDIAKSDEATRLPDPNRNPFGGLDGFVGDGGLVVIGGPISVI